MRKLLWIFFAILCVIVGHYPLAYLLGENKFGLLLIKSDTLLSNLVWKASFQVHIICGGVALLVGWTQFSGKLRLRYPRLHRNLGKLYISMVCLSGTTAVYLAFFASTGWIAGLGFGCLGVVWLSSTLQAFRSVRQRNIPKHERFMTYSYAACFAAVMLRIWLPLMTVAFRLEFNVAYPIVAWLCWVPNLLFAATIVSVGGFQQETHDGVSTNKTHST